MAAVGGQVSRAWRAAQAVMRRLAGADPAAQDVRRQGRDAIYLGDHTALTRTIWGHKIFLDTRDISLAPHLLLDGFWEMWITKVFARTVTQGMTVVEVGANVGYYTLLAADLVGPGGRVYAFEANRDVFDLLQRSIEVNGFLDRVTLSNRAVIERPGRVAFRKLQRHQGGSGLVQDPAPADSEPSEEAEWLTVDATSLDDALADAPPVHVLKLDAEGSEWRIIRGMPRLLRRSEHLVAICEFAPDLIRGTGGTPEGFLNDVLAHGFKLAIIDETSSVIDIGPDRLLKMPIVELYLWR